MKKILFVCHGNICRSTMAEALAKHYASELGLSDEFYFASAGTSREELGQPVHYGTLAELRRHGIDPELYLKGKKARQILASEYEDFDLFVVMDNQNLRNILRIFGDDPKNKVKLAKDFVKDEVDKQVADPWYTGFFSATYNDLSKACLNIIRASKEE